MPDELPRSVFPRRWFPFEGPQEQVEEVVREKIKLCGHYDPAIIPDCKAKYFDEAHNLDVILTFLRGNIFMEQKPRPTEGRLVVLGDDAKIYDDAGSLPSGVRALDSWVEKKVKNFS